MDWRIPQRRTIPAVLSGWRDTQPDKLALRIAGADMTYADLWQRSVAMGNALTELGVGAGDAVGVFMDNSPEVIDVWFGCAQIGAIYVPINVNYKGEFLRHQLATAEAKVAVVDQGLATELERVIPELSDLKTVIIRPESPGSTAELADEYPGVDVLTTDWALAHERDSLTSTYEVSWKDPCAVVFTAGTTGPSKGVTMTHNYLVCAADQVYKLRGGTDEHTTFAALPLFHLAAMSVVVLGPVANGATGVLDQRFSPSNFWDRVREEGADHIVTLGAMVVMLLNQEPRDDDADNPATVAIAAPVPVELHDTYEKRFGITALQLYAQSEAYPLMVAPIENPAPPGYSGKTNPLFTVKLFDDDDCEVPTGESGEVCIRPNEPHVMSEGYFKNPAATAERWRNGWFHTGDLGRFDNDGFFEFVDRKKDYLRRRGENISSFEVERAVNAHEAVAEVAVIATPSEVTEDDVVAVIVPQPGATINHEAIMDHCVDNMPYFAVPRYLWIIDELPKNPVGRVEKYKLRQRILDEGIDKLAGVWDHQAANYVIKR